LAIFTCTGLGLDLRRARLQVESVFIGVFFSPGIRDIGRGFAQGFVPVSGSPALFPLGSQKDRDLYEGPSSFSLPLLTVGEAVGLHFLSFPDPRIFL